MAVSIIHPNVHRNWDQWSSDQTLHVIAAYCNPFRWRTRRHLMNDFRYHMECTPNVKLYVGETSYGDRPFEVTEESNPNDFQFRTDCVLWHKENIYNVVASRLPANAKYVAFLDCDFHMVRHDWALEAIHQLQHHKAVQLFSSYASLNANQRPFRMASSFAYNYIHGLAAFAGKGNAANYENKSNEPPYPGAPGGGWAFDLHTFNKMGGLLDTCILGSGDWHLAFGMIGEADEHSEMRKAAPGYIEAIHTYQKTAFEVIKANIGVVENHAIHGFHGSFTNRGYGSRVQILAETKFNPYTDLMRDRNGLYRLTPNKEHLQTKIMRYFSSRSEDDPTMASFEKPMV